MTIEILIGVAVFAFVVLVIFTVLTLIKISKATDRILIQLDRFSTDFAVTQIELNKVLTNCNHISQHVNEKIKDLDPLFYSVNKVGSALKSTTNFVEMHQCETHRKQEHDLRESIANYAELADVIIRILKNLKGWR